MNDTTRNVVLAGAIMLLVSCGSDDTDDTIAPDAANEDSSALDTGKPEDTSNTPDTSDTNQGKDTGCTLKCDDKSCGDDGCGGTCGMCGLFEECTAENQCVAVLNCIKAENVVSGSCITSDACLCLGCVTDGICDFYFDDCVCPDCQEANLCNSPNLCIDDGACDPYNEGCQCADCSEHPLCGCTPDCDAKVCGDDGCLGSCGGCDAGLVCNDAQSACVACTPNCEGIECGNDGCGGSCGICENAQGCSGSGQCIEVPLGDSCANPKVIGEVPFSDTDNSTLYGDSNLGFGACTTPLGENGALVPDVAYQFTPKTSGQYVFSIALAPPIDPLEPGKPGDDHFPTLIYLLNNCGAAIGSLAFDAACVGFSGNLWNAGAGASWVVALEADTPYFIVLDGAIPGLDQGNYTFTLDAACKPDCEGKSCGDDGCGSLCGTCATNAICSGDGACKSNPILLGDNCDNPFETEVKELPWSTTGDTSKGTDTQSYGFVECPGSLDGSGKFSRDQLYAYTPKTSGVYTVTVDATFNASVKVVKDCFNSTSCMAAANNIHTAGSESLTVALKADEKVIIVVDGAGMSDVSGPYTLSISAPCLPLCDGLVCGDNGCGGTCGTCPDGSICDGGGACVDVSSTAGNTCINPQVVDAAALPYKATGDTSDGPTTDNYTGLYGFCPGLYEDTGKGAADHAYIFTPSTSGAYTVSVESTHDAAVYVPTGCGDIANTCIWGNNGTEADTLLLQADAGTTYFVIVDGHAGAQGAYTLNVAVCASACDGKICGTDGCGSTCGTCTGDDTCSQDGQCVAKTCKGFCGGQSAVGCYCDTLCFDFGDCCPDICEKCVEEFPGDPADCKP